VKLKIDHCPQSHFTLYENESGAILGMWSFGVRNRHGKKMARFKGDAFC
jgi:hypothetical protein